MTSIEFITIEVADTAAADRFYDAAFGLGSRVRTRVSDAATSGFRGFTMSLIVSQPATVDGFVDSAVATGAKVVKAAEKSLWGYGAVVQAPDGTIWTIASSSKKNSGPATREVEAVVLQLGCEDVGASKRFYAERGLTVSKSFGGRYVEFDSGPVKLTLNKRKALAKNAGVAAEGSGAHRIVIGGDAGAFSDPDGFAWEAARSGASATG
ncbi:glyoxalase [Asanoa sp. WMMD1127]|uniref:glyoxalase n=1 Tax=Asanoa sp. WMMD1127 TaxID=3016107 RepID=UPI002415A419|nr:glyoxalase [Asanoa sp. WMMD1127]MDG4827086.1 glyoxalase [Asanoa sp. WMMD1127]